jgi:hypothetical protein
MDSSSLYLNNIILSNLTKLPLPIVRNKPGTSILIDPHSCYCYTITVTHIKRPASLRSFITEFPRYGKTLYIIHRAR